MLLQKKSDFIIVGVSYFRHKMYPFLGKTAAILGCQWGDEGKGKLVDILSKDVDVIARATGGANAGHTIYIPGTKGETQKIVFHLIPAGIINPQTIGVVGNGCVIHIPTLFEEIETLKKNGVSVEGRLKISDRAHIVLEYHKELDAAQEEKKGKNAVGTTKRGIGPCYTDKIMRIGLRMHELRDAEKYKEKIRTIVKTLAIKANAEEEIAIIEKYRDALLAMMIDTGAALREMYAQGKTIVFEGANGALLDIDHGTYPYVTSSSPTIGGLYTGLGVPPQTIGSIIGIVKAYMTRVGSGPFPTEDLGENGETLRTRGGEFGSTTGRPRRCGWFDAVATRYALALNGCTHLNLTKLDILDTFSEIKIAVGYKLNGKMLTTFPASLDDLGTVEVVYETLPGWHTDISAMTDYKSLPENCQKYVEYLEKTLAVPITFIGIGQRRDQMIIRT